LVWVAKITELSDFLTRVESWWKESLFKSVKENLHNNRESIEVKKFLRANSPRILMDSAIKPLNKTVALVRKIQYLQVLCPESKIPEEHTELQLCLTNLKSLYSFLLPQMESMKKFIGDVDELDVCKDSKSFLFIYQQFRTQYAEIFGMDFKMDVIKEARDRKREENNLPSVLHTTLPVIECPNVMQLVGVKKTNTPIPSPRPSPSPDKTSPHGGTPGRETLNASLQKTGTPGRETVNASSQKADTPGRESLKTSSPKAVTPVRETLSTSSQAAVSSKREMLSNSSQKAAAPPISRSSSASYPSTGDASVKNSPSASPRVVSVSSSGKKNDGPVSSSRRKSSAYEEGRFNSSSDQYRGTFFPESEQQKRTVVLAEQPKQNSQGYAVPLISPGAKGDD